MPTSIPLCDHLLPVDGRRSFLSSRRSLRYVYEISSDPKKLSILMREGLVQQNCTYEGLKPVVEAGATIEHLYLRSDGTKIDTVYRPPAPETIVHVDQRPVMH